MLSVDFEDWYHILNTEINDSVELWSNQNSIIESSTKLLLDVLEREGVKITFFVISALASDYKSILEEIISRGHEIASHSKTHRSFERLSMEEIMWELKESKMELEDVLKIKINGFRAPGFSIKEDRTGEFYKLLHESGYIYDSSWFNGYRLSGGIVGRARGLPFTLNQVRVFPINGPWPLGGAYLRFTPNIVFKAVVANKAKYRMLYLHPRDYYLSEDLIREKRNLRFTYGIKGCLEKIECYLRHNPNRDMRLITESQYIGSL